MKKTPVFHRLMALFLVLVLAFSLTATVFATEASSTESTEPTAEVTGSPVSPSEPEETSAPTQPSTVSPTTVETEDITVPTTEETLPPETEPTAPPATDPPVTEPQPNNSLPTDPPATEPEETDPPATDPQEVEPEELSQEEIDALLAEILADAPSAYVPRTWLAAQLALRTGLEPVMPLAGTVIPVSSDGITIPQTWYGLAWKRSSGANTRAVRMLMANLHVSLEDALKLLEIPKSERNTYRKICAARAGQKKSPEIG